MNILYCGDSNIENGLIISILSLIKYNQNKFNIYVLSMDYETNEKKYKKVSKKCIDTLNKRIKKVNKESSIKLIDITKLYNKEKPVMNEDTLFTPYCMLRLYSDLIKELPDKILYLDNDVVFFNKIDTLYNIDITNYEFAGALDYYGSHIYKKNIFKKDYINSGVLLLNLKLIRETNLFKKCRDMCANKKMLLPDQSALNKLATSKLIISRNFNEQHDLNSNTIIRHFSTTFKFFPVIKTQKIKPWDIENVHKVLNIYEFDDILDEYVIIKETL